MILTNKYLIIFVNRFIIIKIIGEEIIINYK